MQYNRYRIAQALHIKNHQLILARQIHGDGILAQTGQDLLDLWETNQKQLLETGLTPSSIEIAGIGTYTHQGFFSA